MRQKEYWVIEGVIGAGKSTLLQRLATYAKERLSLEISLIPEPLEEWERSGMLQRAYEDPKKWNFPAQCSYFDSRVKKIRQVCGENPSSQIFLGERSLFTDRMFWNIQHTLKRLADNEEDAAILHTTYLRMWELWVDLIPILPTRFIYLRPSLDACMARLTERGREAEKSVDQAYQEALLQEHDRYLLNGKKEVTLPNGCRVPVLILEGNANFRDDDAAFEEIARAIFA